jgi:N-acetylmuramic acid 6-phosphate etherase
MSAAPPPGHEFGESIPLASLSWPELVGAMQLADEGVLPAVRAASTQIIALAEAAYHALAAGGRLFYLGAGTSGRLGILDASECPPTFGVPHGLVIGIIAGGDGAIRKAVEFAEDDTTQGWADLQAQQASPADLLIGLSASGSTPYVVGAMAAARAAGLRTGCVVCRPRSPIAGLADFPVEVLSGQEFLPGSSRLKAGTAQKMVLNTITTTAMIKLGRVTGNRMVDMQLSNAKLIARGTAFVQEATNLPEAEAKALLLKYGGVRLAIAAWEAGLRRTPTAGTTL